MGYEVAQNTGRALKDKFDESGISESARAASSAVYQSGAAGVAAIGDSEAYAAATTAASDASSAVYQTGAAGVTAIGESEAYAAASVGAQ